MASKPNTPEDFADRVRASAEQIWLAGVGAFAKAQQEGSKLFDKLAKEGEGLQRKAQPAQEMFQGFAERFGAQAEESMVKGLRKLGVPTRAELDALTARVAALEAAAAKPARKAATAKRSAAKTPKPAPRTTAARKTAPR